LDNLPVVALASLARETDRVLKEILEKIGA
jgi:hypothetical protein